MVPNRLISSPNVILERAYGLGGKKVDARELEGKYSKFSSMHTNMLLTVKFGNRQRRHRLKIIIGCSISESADGSYQVANSRIPAIFG